MRKSKYILVSCCFICGALIVAFVVNILFKIHTESIFSAEWKAGDALSYVGTMIGALSTFALGLVAYKQNEKLQDMEDHNYIATNSCMVLIDEIQIKPKADIPINFELHTEQILMESDNKDEFPSGYTIEVKLKKIDASVQATPSLIYVSQCTMFVGDGESNTLESDIWADNVRDGYTRMAIRESGIAFNCKLLVSRNKQKKFENDIQREKNKLTAEIKFYVITDKYVMTKCKCRAYCYYQNNGGKVIWKSRDPMVFFYGHELKNRNEIQVFGE